MKKIVLFSLSALALIGCNVESTGTGPTSTPTVSATPTVTATPTSTPATGTIAALTFNDANLEACVDATGVTLIRDLTSLTCINQGITDASDISELFALQTLNLSRNPLTSINVSNMALTYLNVSHLAGQGTLTSLSLTGLEQLEILNVSGNQLTSLSTSSSPNLSEVAFAYNQLSSVDFTNNAQLAVLHGQHNQLDSVTVANGPLTDVDLSNNRLNSINFPQPYSLRVANLSNNLFFDFPDWSDGQRDETRNLETLNLSNNSLTALAMPNVVEALILDGNSFTAWAPAKNGSLTTLSMDNNKLASITLPAGLTNVSLASNELSTLSLPSTVTWLDISDNAFASLNLASNANLRSLNVATNQLDRFDFPEMPTGLTSLNLANNNFTSIDADRFLDLTSLTVDDNALTLLDVDVNTALTYLSANSASLGNDELVLTENTLLEKLYLAGNKFTDINLSANTALNLLDITGNPLTTKSISKIQGLGITTLLIDSE